MARKTWWCDNCGYESRSRGRCSNCGERLLLSPLPELEPGSPDEEVGYGLAGWDKRAHVQLIAALISANIPHRFEDEELVVRTSDEAEVDDTTGALRARKFGGAATVVTRLRAKAGARFAERTWPPRPFQS